MLYGYVPTYWRSECITPGVHRDKKKKQWDSILTEAMIKLHGWNTMDHGKAGKEARERAYTAIQDRV